MVRDHQNISLHTLARCLLALGCFLATFSSHLPAIAADLNGDPRYNEVWKKSQALKDQPSTDTTPIEFSLGNVHYKVPRNYIVVMDDWKGGPQTLVAFKVTFPGFEPYSNTTKDCLDLAPLYRRQGCMPIKFNIIGDTPVSDDEGFSNVSKLFHSQKPEEGPYGFEMYEEGPDNARINVYRKKLSNHTLIIDCIVGDISQKQGMICSNHSRLPNQNAINYILNGGREFLGGEQLEDAEQIDEGLRALINSFTLTGGKP